MYGSVLTTVSVATNLRSTVCVEEVLVVVEDPVADAAADALDADADAAILDAIAAASIDPVLVLDEVDTEFGPIAVVPVALEDGIGAPTS